MDKSLKKLSRVELLELMVSLSEDYEDLSAENARLKRMLSSQRLPKSAKVGSIAEASLKANGYFEAAQRSADEYLREIKHLRDELAIRAQNASGEAPTAAQTKLYAKAEAQAHAQAQAIIRDAQQRANQIVSRAQAQAQAIVGDAQQRAEQQMARANAYAQQQSAYAQQPMARGGYDPAMGQTGQIPMRQGMPMQGAMRPMADPAATQSMNPQVRPLSSDRTVQIPPYHTGSYPAVQGW